MFKELVIHLGYLKSIIIFTLIVTLASMELTGLMMWFIHRPLLPRDGYVISFICPLIIAPPILHFLLKLTFELNNQEQKMRELAQTDSLTKLLTRRAWFEFAEQYQVISKRQKQAVSLLMLDLDNFKKINDEYGHLAGDAIIRELSNISKLICRESDIVGRFGGEEFIFLLPNTNAEQACALCERLHDQIRSCTVEFEQHQLKFTASIGIACQTEQHSHSLDHLISLADDALYKAKSHGKNGSFLHRESTTDSTPSYA
jgi:diguanylate cyclase (GGDEF)-like protein